MHQVYYLLRRGFDGIKRRPALHILSVFTLTATFLSFITTLTAASNIHSLVKKWVGSAELTIYLEEGATEHDMTELANALRAISQIERVETVNPQSAKQRFAKQMTDYGDMVNALPDTTFPASIDVYLASDIVLDMNERAHLAARIKEVATVAQVDPYDDWFSKLAAISTISQAASIGFGILSLVVAMLVVSSVVKSSLNARAKEIEVLELVGATKRHIRFPFQLEGALQTLTAMLLAVVFLHFMTNYLQESLKDIMPLIGMELHQLGTKPLLVLIAGSAFAGILGSHLSLKQRHEV